MRPPTPDQLVDEGELITVEVAEVDPRRHRVRLCTTVDSTGSSVGSERWRNPATSGVSNPATANGT
ncbi:hypothetical protein GFH48_01535 [Streptomyces fagopyri]|uniref:Uncharacterized protein n=1 Tax=Streptomyces fagopyri TaxID=2662397 RepID=A0A5Q0L5W1_9ACTN|nr:hypothetical protein GFH48_01535 [Streptomyces fagopyri]